MNPLVRVCLLAFVAAGALASAGDQAAPPAPPPAPSPAAPPATPATTTAPDLEEFVPTEKVSADQAVAFPVDI